jgi:hypothetical protein
METILRPAPEHVEIPVDGPGGRCTEPSVELLFEDLDSCVYNGSRSWIRQDDAEENGKDSWTICHYGTLAESDDLEALKDKLGLGPLYGELPNWPECAGFEMWIPLPECATSL